MPDPVPSARALPFSDSVHLTGRELWGDEVRANAFRAAAVAALAPGDNLDALLARADAAL